MNEHIIYEVNEEKKYKKVWCKDGHYITNWDKVNILEYNSFRIMYCPINTDLSNFYCVTEEENENLYKLQEIELKNEELKKQ